MRINPAFLFLAAIAFSCSATAAEGETRKLIKMPSPMRQHMLENMRDHLMAITEIQQALGSGKFDTAATIAEERIGMSSLTVHGASHIAPYLPKQMQEIGTQMHKAASQFALAAQDASVDGNLKRAVGALSEITRQCVACHASYRIH
jgi:hypothetical protein